METSLTPVVAASPVVVQKDDRLEVSAQNPAEMSIAHTALIAWCEKKIATQKVDAAELSAARDEARKHKWKTSTLTKHAAIAEKRVTFFEKIKAALEAGFIIVPNFPVSLFAIRTDKKNVKTYGHMGSYRFSDSHYEQAAPALPIGEGEHKNPDPVVMQCDYTTAEQKAKGQKSIHFQADRFDDIEFPLTMAKPHIMQATTRAMALKIFDEFGILPAAHRYQDPMIVARIVDPRSTRHDRKTVSFIVAWHLDTSVL